MSVLERIIAYKRDEVAARKTRKPLARDASAKRAEQPSGPRGFARSAASSARIALL